MSKQSSLFDEEFIDCNTGNDKSENFKEDGITKIVIYEPGLITKKNVLALDIATNTGFCTATASGSWKLTPKKDESKNMRLIRFRAKLKEICELEEIKLIVFESMAVYSKFPNFVGAEMIGVLKLFCADAKIDHKSYAPTEIKKFGTGKGNCKKDKMIEAARRFNPSVESDDEADAVILYHLAIKDLEL